MERRFTTPKQCQPVVVEARADGGTRITGYAAVFYRASDPGTEYELWSDLVERIDRSAFDRAIKETHDVRGLFNHDANYLLGRTSAGTLSLSVDSTGLKYLIDLPDTQAGRDVATSIKRGDLSGSSFSFSPTKVTYETDAARKVDIRTIEDVTLYDVGPVTFPAYEATTVGARSSDSQDALAGRDEWKAERRRRMIAVRQRVLTLDDVSG